MCESSSFNFNIRSSSSTDHHNSWDTRGVFAPHFILTMICALNPRSGAELNRRLMCEGERGTKSERDKEMNHSLHVNYCLI